MTALKKKDLVLVDGSGYIFRAYYALPPMYKSDGTPVNAVFGFCNMLLKLIEDIQMEKGGEVSIAVIFDAARETFRNEIYSDYKANRSDPPEDLKPQFDLIKKVPEAFNLQSIELLGFEADDLIASYSNEASKLGRKVTIISADKDLMQLLTKEVSIIDPMKKKEITKETVMEKFGVLPDKVIDVQALAGDSSDNVPGVPGIGPKIASQLINEYGSVEELIKKVDSIKQEKRRNSIIDNKDLAIISKKLVTLKQDVPLPLDIEKLEFKPLDVNKLLNFLDEMEFNRIKASVISKYGNSSIKQEQKKYDKNDEYNFYLPLNEKINNENYDLIDNENSLIEWIEIVKDYGLVAVDCETNSLNAVDADIVGFSMSIENGKSCYVPLGHKNCTKQINLDRFKQIIKPILNDHSILKIGQNIKFDLIVLGKLGLELNNIDDTMLMSYVLRTGKRGHGLDELSLDLLSYETQKYDEVTTIEKKKISFEDVEVHSALNYAAEDADVTFRLYQLLKIELIKNKLYDFYFYVERPLIKIIAEMETNGCKIDNDALVKLSSQFSEKIKQIEKQIFDDAGEKFNVGSPKQLGEILFSKLKLPYSKKGKSGNFQTDVKVLEKLKSEKFDIARKILDWRQFSKLKNTYCEGLLSRESKKTGRIHTSYGMSSTLTGRLSSNDPNLQNIPIKNEEGRQIRKSFIAPKGFKIVSIDYSQIELRILAHVAKIESLIDAFRENQDIHNVTAKNIFQISENSLTSDHRRKAKTINFGIIYGISPYGLASQLDISNSEAKSFIDQYFLRYPGIKDYMKRTIQICRETGSVFTPFGRRIFIPFINDKIATRRNFAERSAINAPIQGGAADMIKLAMPKVSKFLKENSLDTKMLLQVHDELVFEVPEKEIDFIENEVPKIMTNAHELILKLNVPLKAEVGIGKNWDDAH